MRPDADALIWYVAEVQDDGLEAQVKVISVGGDGLPGFLRDLAEDFRCGKAPGTGSRWRASSGSRQFTMAGGMSPCCFGSVTGRAAIAGTWLSRLR